MRGCAAGGGGACCIGGGGGACCIGGGGACCCGGGGGAACGRCGACCAGGGGGAGCGCCGACCDGALPGRCCRGWGCLGASLFCWSCWVPACAERSAGARAASAVTRLTVVALALDSDAAFRTVPAINRRWIVFNLVFLSATAVRTHGRISSHRGRGSPRFKQLLRRQA